MIDPLLITLIAGAALMQSPPPDLQVTMIALGVKDPARSVTFYRDTLGLQLIGKPGEVTLLRAGSVTIVLNQPLARAAGDSMVGAVEVIFPVPSVEAGYRNLKDRGCGFIAGPHEVTSGMWAATFTDPDGHRLTILGGR